MARPTKHTENSILAMLPLKAPGVSRSALLETNPGICETTLRKKLAALVAAGRATVTQAGTINAPKRYHQASVENTEV